MHENLITTSIVSTIPTIKTSLGADTIREMTRYASLTLAGAFFGTYSILICNHIFVNAQTNNIISLLLSVTHGSFQEVLWRICILIIYCIAISLTVILPEKLKKQDYHWESVCLFAEALCACFVGFLPSSFPSFLFIAPLFFASALQYNTFKSCRGVGVSTLFCTNNIRQFLINFWQYRTDKKEHCLIGMQVYGMIILSFALGVFLCCFCVHLFNKSSIFIAAILLLINYIERKIYYSKSANS